MGNIPANDNKASESRRKLRKVPASHLVKEQKKSALPYVRTADQILQGVPENSGGGGTTPIILSKHPLSHAHYNLDLNFQITSDMFLRHVTTCRRPS